MNDRILELVYESTKAPNYDYLLIENVDNFNWDRFWSVFYTCKQCLTPLYESFEKKDSNEYTDLYEVVATNGMSFKLSVSLYDKQHVYKDLLSTLFMNFEDRHILADLRKAVDKTEHPIITINFKDSQDEIKTTNKLGNYAYSVIQSIKDAIVTSLHERNERFPDVLYFFILKSEQRKLDFFVKMIERIFPRFKNYYIDENSDNELNLAYFYV